MLAYQRVYKQILQALKDNTYPIGSLLPAEPELEKIYGVSRTTVRRAIAQLAEEGYVKVKQGHRFEEHLSDRCIRVFQIASFRRHSFNSSRKYSQSRTNERSGNVY